jgi:DNA-directed RNA polymerase subunit H (RpoH/RPB5)
MSSENDIVQLCKSRKTIIEQLAMQGYNTSDHELFSADEINIMNKNNQLDMLLEKRGTEEHNNGNKIYVKYALDKTLRPKTLQDVIDDLFYTEGILSKEDTLFVVLNGNSVNDTMVNFICDLWETDKIFVILQPIIRLTFNVLNHTLVAPHRILSKSEKISIMTKYNIMNDGEFPQISRTDPVATAIGIRPGEVCEILRPSKTAIIGIYYRICTNKKD